MEPKTPNDTPVSTDISSSTEKLKPDKKRHHINRIPLSQEASTVVRETLDEMIGKYPLLQINKKDLVNWIITDFFKKLSLQSEKALFNKFYDEVKFLEHSLKELKLRKSKGEDITLDQILKEFKPKTIVSKKRKSKTIDTPKNSNVNQES